MYIHAMFLFFYLASKSALYLIFEIVQIINSKKNAIPFLISYHHNAIDLIAYIANTIH